MTVGQGWRERHKAFSSLRSSRHKSLSFLKAFLELSRAIQRLIYSWSRLPRTVPLLHFSIRRTRAIESMKYSCETRVVVRLVRVREVQGKQLPLTGSK